MQITPLHSDPHLHNLSDLVNQIIGSMCTTSPTSNAKPAHE